MDHDKPEMTSKTGEKEKSSANEEKSNSQSNQDDCEESNPTDNAPTQMLQLSEPFFVADTLEDDESMIIPPTQEDTAPILIPNTPACESKSKKRAELDPNESTITVLEETCIDLESNTEQKHSSKEDTKENAADNETDLTQDLELEPTQPIVPSYLVEPVEFKHSNDADGKKDEDDDDEWQLKFSESQTQDILNFDKNDQDFKDTHSETSHPPKEPVKDYGDDDDDDDLPATLSIEVPPRIDEKRYDNNIEILEPKEKPETVEIQSDDEVEPSQSCLSEYKRETISSSYKVQSGVDSHNTEVSDEEEIPKLHSMTDINVENNVKNDVDIEIIDGSQNKTINLSETESKSALNESEIIINKKSLDIEEIPVVNQKDDKKDREQFVNDIEEKRTNKSGTAQFSAEHKDNIETPMKICEKEPKIKSCEIESNGEQMVQMERTEEKEVAKEKEAKSNEIKCNSDDPVTNSDEHNGVKEMECDNMKPAKDICKDSAEIKEHFKNETEVMEINEEKQAVSNIDKDPKNVVHHDVKDTEDLCKKAEVSVLEPAHKGDSDALRKESHESPSKLKYDDVSKHAESEATKSSVVSDSQQNKLDSEIVKPITKQVVDEKFAASPSFAMAPPPAVTGQHVGSTKNKIFQSKSDSSRTDKKVSIRSYKDIKSLQRFLKSIGITLNHEHMAEILSMRNEEVEIKPVFSLRNQKIFLKDYSIEVERQRRESGPFSSSSTTTSSTISSKASGEIADISGSLSSGKSVSSCGMPVESTSQSINILSSQSTSENFPKTSTQKSQAVKGFSEIFIAKEEVEVSKIDTKVTPSKSKGSSKSSEAKRKRGMKSTESASGEASSVNEVKSKKRRVKTKLPVEDKGEETEESKDSLTEVKPRKTTRRKKGATAVPDLTPEEIKSIVENVQITEDESSAQDEANFGSILPGVKVMARWNDGYYYSGMVQSQEIDGRWAVRFEDGFVRTVTLENLIKIAILPKGTSVLVQSPSDNYYDPGIVCGHFREGNKVGYEVELDNGVTRQYPRSAVILSGDQAKLIMVNQPPRTPRTMTINLDNLVEGKRRRKSVQSPKSPRVVTRSKKPDSNLESTADSSSTETVSVKDSENEHPPNKKRKVKKDAEENAVSTSTTKTTTSTTKTATNITKTATTTSTSTSSNSIVTKVLPKRSAKKLFKDYAFLLTNADRKNVPKPPDCSDSEACKEDEDIVPFDKDELCKHIASGGGIVLEKFDDVKKCTRKHIYLLANSYLRTMKYIQCIAAGISCVKHHWVQNCLCLSEILNLKSYILPSGFSLVTQEVIEWHGKTDIFKGLKIALVSAPESPFVYTWAPVLLTAKAEFVQKWTLPSSVSGCSLVVDVLITNNHCPPDIIQSAKKRKIPIVSSEWIIQSLIIGKKLPYDAHPKFKYDYTEI